MTYATTAFARFSLLSCDRLVRAAGQSQLAPCSGVGARTSPRARMLRAALTSALLQCPQATHEKTAWLLRFARAIYPQTLHCKDV